MSPRELRRDQAHRMAEQIGVDPAALERASYAIWSNLNPQTHTFTRALSLASAALVAEHKAG